MNLTDKTILVTGATGFIGSNLVDRLINKGAIVIAYDNLSASSLQNLEHLKGHPNLDIVIGDVRDQDVLENIISKCDFIFHLAATNVGTSTITPKIDLQTNIAGTLNILEAVKKNPHVRMVHVSSGSVLGSSEDESGMTEDSILKPTTPYAISKMAGEKYAEFYAKEYGLKISIIRPFHVFGPRQDFEGRCGVINIFIHKILLGMSPIVWGDGSQVKCFTYVEDLIDGVVLLAQNDSTIGEIYNCASKTRISIKDLALLLIERYAEDKLMPIMFIDPKVGENMRPIPNTTKIEKLGFKASYEFEEGLDLAKDWVMENM